MPTQAEIGPEKWCIVANHRADSTNYSFRPGARLVMTQTTGGGLAQGRAIMRGIARPHRSVSTWLSFKHTHNWRVSCANHKDQEDSFLLFDTRKEAQEYLNRITPFLPKRAIESRAQEIHPV